MRSEVKVRGLEESLFRAHVRHRLLAGVLVIAASTSGAALFILVRRRSPFDDIGSQPGGWPGALLVFLAGALIHELLHGLTWMIAGRIGWRGLVLLRTRRKLGVILAPRLPLRRSAYLAGVGAPLLMVCTTLLAGIVMDRALLVLWSVAFLVESYSDLVILLAWRRDGRSA